MWFDGPYGRVRVGLLAISALVVLTAFVELGSQDRTHLLPMVSGLLLVAAVLVLVLTRPGPALLAVRVALVVVLGLTAGTLLMHILATTAGPRSFNRHLTLYLSNLYTFTGWLGGWTPSRVASGLLAEGALLVLLATLGLDSRTDRRLSRDPRGLWS